MTITGIGEYILTDNQNRILQKCVAEFTFTKETSFNSFAYEKAQEWESIDTSAAITSVTYKLMLEFTNNSLDSLSDLFGISLEEVTETLPQFEDSGAVDLSTSIETSLLDLNQQRTINRSRFTALGYTTNGGILGLVFENLYLESSTSMSPSSDSITQTFIVETPKVYQIV